jgi:hypothetical protein
MALRQYSDYDEERFKESGKIRTLTLLDLSATSPEEDEKIVLAWGVMASYLMQYLLFRSFFLGCILFSH